MELFRNKRKHRFNIFFIAGAIATFIHIHGWMIRNNYQMQKKQ